jgi:hypothetical protein
MTVIKKPKDALPVFGNGVQIVFGRTKSNEPQKLAEGGKKGSKRPIEGASDCSDFSPDS